MRQDDSKTSNPRPNDDRKETPAEGDENRMFGTRSSHTTDDDVSDLGGVGGAMTDEDEHPHLIGDVRAGNARLPLMESDRHPGPDADKPEAPDSDSGPPESRP